MPRYEPIDLLITFKVSASDLAGFTWDTNGIQADFVIPGDVQHFLSLKFDRQCIVRILDEMALSIEQNDTPPEVVDS